MIHVRVRNGMAPDGGNGGVTEGDLRGSYSDLIITSGVADVEGGQALVTEAGSPNMSVLVADGVVYVPNSSFDEFDADSIKFWEAVISSEGAVAISANTSGQTRYDIICVKVNSATVPDENASNIATLEVVEGPPGGSAPAVPSNHEKLAEVRVVNGATEILNADITDSRNQVYVKPEILDAPIVTATDGATVTFNLGNGLYKKHRVVLGGNRTLALSNVRVGQTFMIDLVQDGAGSRTVTWFSGIKWPYNVVPTLTTTLNKIDSFGFICTGVGAYQGYQLGASL